MNQQETKTDLDMLWGAEQIGRAINLNKRRTFHALETGQIPARKVSGKWCISRRKLIEFMEREGDG